LINAFSEVPALLVVFAGILGLVVGSFLNVVIHRLPKMMERDWQMQCADLRNEPAPDLPSINLFKPRSHCPHCGHVIRAWENVPVVSWLALRGKCSACKAPISLRYPAVEVFTGVVSAVVAWKYGPTLQTLGALALCWGLISAAFIDADTQLLPDDITLPLLWLGLLLNLNAVYVPLSDAVIGAMAGYLVLWSIYWVFKLLTGKEGMGYGDFKLLAALGAWLGWQMLPAIVLLSSVVGAVIGIAMMVFARHGRDKPMPFGPYLAGAGVLALLVGGWLNQNYLSFL
jgi:leader peptidase (prepilin peptidase)/N-methyltransferase